ncbi:MAG TPA: hypothetical protein DCQ14_02860, partial [Firmicutes bacterium]|nr:hypothetical protein [Bacillota bacterium]
TNFFPLLILSFLRCAPFFSQPTKLLASTAVFQGESAATIVFITHDIDEAVYLADRIAVFSALPGRICEIIPAAAGRPRDRTGYDFIRLREKVFAALSLGYKETVEYYL